MAYVSAQNRIVAEVCSGRAECGQSMDNGLVLIDYPGGVFERGRNVFAAEVRVTSEDLVNGIAAGYHAEDISHEDSCAPDHRFSRTNGRIDFDSIRSTRCTFHFGFRSRARFISGRHKKNTLAEK